MIKKGCATLRLPTLRNLNVWVSLRFSGVEIRYSHENLPSAGKLSTRRITLSGILQPFHAQNSIVSVTPTQNVIPFHGISLKICCAATTSTHKLRLSESQVSIIFVETQFASTFSATDPPAEWAQMEDPSVKKITLSLP